MMRIPKWVDRTLLTIWLICGFFVGRAFGHHYALPPDPPPIYIPTRCTLANLLYIGASPWYENGVVCQGPDGSVILVGSGRCDKECQRICLGREQ